MNDLFKTCAFLLICLFIGCNSDDDNQDPEGNDPIIVDLVAAKLNDFQLSEVKYTNIDIIQPEIVAGVETTSGEIIITIPAQSDNLSLSLAAVNFDQSKFIISPAIGSVQSFEIGKNVTYTIKSIEDSQKNIHYIVSVIKEDTPIEEGLKVTGFKFEKSKNPGLPSDIEAMKIAEYPGTNLNAIYILVPVGTDLTNLTPSIDFEGEELQYKQGESDFIMYPEAGLSTDFTSDYSFLSYEDKNEFVLSVINSRSQNKYRIIVEIENPIELQENSVSTPDIVEGDTRRFSLKWINRGNHPIQRKLDASNYIDNTSDNKGNIFSAFLEVANPEQGAYIRPGEEGNVSVSVNADGVAIGNYDVNIVFAPKYDLNRAMINDIEDDLNPIENIFVPIELNIKTTIINR